MPNTQKPRRRSPQAFTGYTCDNLWGTHRQKWCGDAKSGYQMLELAPIVPTIEDLLELHQGHAGRGLLKVEVRIRVIPLTPEEENDFRTRHEVREEDGKRERRKRYLAQLEEARQERLQRDCHRR